MFGSGRYARTDPWHAHDPGYDVRSAYRLVADALTRDPEAQNDGRSGRRAQGRSLPQFSSKGRVGLVSGILAGGPSRSSSLRAPMQEPRLHFQLRSEGGVRPKPFLSWIG